MLGQVEMDIAEWLGIDVLPVEPLVQFFGLRRENFKPWTFWDGTETLVFWGGGIDTQKTLPAQRSNMSQSSGHPR